VEVGAIAATAHQAVATAQALTQLLAKDKARLAELGRLAGSARQILDALFAHPVSNIAALTGATGLTPATIGKARGTSLMVGNRTRVSILVGGYTEYEAVLFSDLAAFKYACFAALLPQ
jgi:hypothetical protein